MGGLLGRGGGGGGGGKGYVGPPIKLLEGPGPPGPPLPTPMKAFLQEKRLHSEREKVSYFEVSAIQALPLNAKRKLPDGKKKITIILIYGRYELK